MNSLKLKVLLAVSLVFGSVSVLAQNVQLGPEWGENATQEQRFENAKRFNFYRDAYNSQRYDAQYKDRNAPEDQLHHGIHKKGPRLIDTDRPPCFFDLSCKASVMVLQVFQRLLLPEDLSGQPRGGRRSGGNLLLGDVEGYGGRDPHSEAGRRDDHRHYKF